MGFKCEFCNKFILITPEMGVKNRNHCDSCLYSKHVDNDPGDRKAACQAQMMPIGLTFKQSAKQGELMIIHLCAGCEKVSINRIAADDDIEAIQTLLRVSIDMEEDLREELLGQGIRVLSEEDEREVNSQLFGYNAAYESKI